MALQLPWDAGLQIVFDGYCAAGTPLQDGLKPPFGKHSLMQSRRIPVLKGMITSTSDFGLTGFLHLENRKTSFQGFDCRYFPQALLVTVKYRRDPFPNKLSSYFTTGLCLLTKHFQSVLLVLVGQKPKPKTKTSSLGKTVLIVKRQLTFLRRLAAIRMGREREESTVSLWCDTILSWRTRESNLTAKLGKNAIHNLPEPKHRNWEGRLQRQKIHLIQEHRNRMWEWRSEMAGE